MYNILICDDDADIRAALKIYLSSEGYNLFEAENGAQALEIAAREPLHLILLDVMMPAMDGIAARSPIPRAAAARPFFHTLFFITAPLVT